MNLTRCGTCGTSTATTFWITGGTIRSVSFAPNTSYSSRIEYNREGMELKELIKALHDNEIDVILDVVFNHTAEGNEIGPSFCFKGFDNNIYYMLTLTANTIISAGAAIP